MNYESIEEHKNCVVAYASDEIRIKYQQGQEEHGGELWKKGLDTLLVPQLRAEALDLIVYTDVIRDQISEIRNICNRAVSTDAELCIINHVYFDILRILNGTKQDNK